MALQDNLRADEAVEPWGGIADNPVQIRWLKLNGLFPSESEQLAG